MDEIARPTAPPYPAVLQALFDELNEQQIAVANFGVGPACVTGVPGSGKTKALVARIARMVADGLNPQYILAMTFTRAAASEMNARLDAVGVRGTRIGTIHSVSRQIAAAETGLLLHGRLDDREKMTIELKKVLNDFRRRGSIPDYGVDFEGVHRYIEACKATGLCYIDGDPLGLNMQSEEFLRNRANLWARLAGVRPERLVQIYIELERRRASLNLFDFDDMQLWAWMRLVSDAEVRRRWRERWSVVMVDEAQDSSPVQWDVARLLTGLNSCVSGIDRCPFAPVADGNPHNLMVLGDAAQSLYSWRSAEPRLFVDFAKAHGVTALVLPKNYRSNQTVCSVATGLVRGKEWFLGGAIVSARAPDVFPPAISLRNFGSCEEEAEAVVARCMELAQDRGLRSCAVLSRLRVGLDLVEIECIRRRVKYIKLSAGSFFESKEVRDVLAYLRVAACLDPDGRWLRHVINKPFRYIGAAYISKAETWAQLNGFSLLDGLEQLSSELNHKQREALRRLYELLRELNQIAAACVQREQAAQAQAQMEQEGQPQSENASAAPLPPVSSAEPIPSSGLRQQQVEALLSLTDEALLDTSEDVDSAGPADMIGLVLRRTNYLEELRREEGLLGMDESRVAALVALQRMAHSFSTVAAFLSYVDALAVAVEQAQRGGLRLREDTRDDALVLSTIHRAKGLEFANVFLVDVVQGRFPCAKSLNPDEELRLLYVAVTRAMTTCQISYTGPADDNDPRRVRSAFTFLIERELEALAGKISK